MAKQKSLHARASVVRLCRLHMLLAGLIATQTLIFSAWQLITPQAVLSRWVALTLFFGVVVIVWYQAKQTASLVSPRKLVFMLVAVDIALASFNVYTQRGMAARAVALYAVPLTVVAILRSRSALLATAAFCAAAYVLTALAYFVLNFNEGYKVELYGEVGFYAVMMLLLANMLWVVVRPSART